MNEKTLLQQLQTPEMRNAAFETLVKSYQRVLYYHIRRMVQSHEDTDDILQNTFIAAWRYIEKFRGDSSLKTWLYRIATNEAISFLNTQKKQAKQDLEVVENAALHSTSGHNQIDEATILRKLQAAISMLPEKQRLVFNMRYYDELSFKEISEILDISEGGLKANYHHAAKKIEAFLTGKEMILE
ncbi:MAG: RNA polymerase sigma factor [Bacteroidia bacterium]